MIFGISFMEKKIQNFFNFFNFFWTPFKTIRFFFPFGPKITYFYILGGQHVQLTPQKCFLKAYSTSCPKLPPQDYPDILEPVNRKVNQYSVIVEGVLRVSAF